MTANAPRHDAEPVKGGGRLIAWKTYDPDGEFTGLVFADNAIEAARKVPARHSVYIGGPSPDQPNRPWWFEAWNSGAIDPDELFAHDPRAAEM